MKLQIFKESKTRLPRKKLALLLEAIVNAEAPGRNLGCINLVFTSDRHIRALNKKFRNLDRPTDVLSFGFDDPEYPEDTFGEIYISVPTARRQARQYGITLTDELLHLACHGMLHLFGYDHVKTAEAKKMKYREDHFLKHLRRK
jgi:probable rRNA maturation factor